MVSNERAKRNWLAKRRKEQGLTAKDVSEKIDISRSHYSMIENGLSEPSMKLAFRIAYILGFDVQMFFKGEVIQSATKSATFKVENRRVLVKKA